MSKEPLVRAVLAHGYNRVSLAWNETGAGDLDVITPVLDRALGQSAVDRTMVELLTFDFSQPLFD